MNTLYCLPLGETCREQFIKEAEKYPYGKALFVVPGHYFRGLLRNHSGVRAVIMDYLPNEILRLTDQDTVYKRISRTAQEMLLKTIVEELLAENKLPYFAPLAERDGFVKNLAAFMGELARSDVKPETLEEAFAYWDRPARLQEKDREMELLYTSYREKLQQRDLYDVDGLYRLAIAALEEGRVQLPWDKLYFSEFYQFDDLQRELIRSLSKYCDVQVGLFWEGQRENLEATTQNAYQDLVGMNFQIVKAEPVIKRKADLAFLVENWSRNSHKKITPQNIDITEAYSPENEMAAVLTAIKELVTKGVKTKDIVVLVRSLSDYPGFSDLFKAYGIPTVLPQVTGFSGQALADFLVKLLETAIGSHDVAAWKNLFTAPYCCELYGIKRELLEEEYNEKFFATTRSLFNYIQVSSPENALDSLQELVKKLGQKHTGQEFIDILTEAMDSWQIMANTGTAYQQDRLSLEQVKILAETGDLAAQLCQNLAMAFAQSGEEDKKITSGDFLRLWLAQTQDQLITVKQGNQQGIQVLEVANVQGVIFPYVFLMGIREGLFPKIKFENWLYNDKERADLHSGLGINLEQTSVNVATDRYFFASALAMATAFLHISYYVDDAAGASGYLEELNQYFLRESLPVKKFTATEENCASQEELLNLLAQKPLLGDKETKWLIAQTDKDFARQLILDKVRWEGENKYNGRLGGNQELPFLSASSLDLYVQCPFRYLVAKKWKTESWQPLTEEVQASVGGELYHLVLAEFLGRHLQKNLSSLPKKTLQKELETDFNKVYANFVKKGAITETVLSLQEKKFYLHVLCQWLDTEIAYQEKTELPILPDKLEIGFGLQGSKWPALQLTIDNKVTAFSGQIDRVDTDGEYYFITDYKSGTQPTGKELAEGKALQLPIYVLALENICHVNSDKILGAGYYSLKESKRKGGIWNKEKGKGLPWLKRGQSNAIEEVMDRAEEFIGRCVKGIRTGEFPAAPLKKCPAYCPGYDICRYKLNRALNLQEAGEDHE